MPRGIVRTFDSTRGSGTIEDEDTGREIRVFRESIGEGGLRELYPGDIVEYAVGRNRRGGSMATNVVKVGWEEDDGDDSPREWSF